jgi:hypothetical protein
VLTRVTEVPNEPGRFVAVEARRYARNPATDAKIPIAYRRFAVSARLVSCDSRAEEYDASPVTWKIISGFKSQDDDGHPSREEWRGEDVDVPADVKDARPHLEEALAPTPTECEWFLWE